MRTPSGFLAAILESPEDDTPRLALADWLDENGQPERAEFIRVQCELHRICFAGWTPTEKDQPAIDRLRKRELDLLSGHAWTTWDMPALHPWDRLCFGESPHPQNTQPKAYYSRGFVHAVSCDAEAWRQHGPTLVRQQPIERVSLTGLLPLTATQDAAGAFGLRLPRETTPLWLLNSICAVQKRPGWTVADLISFACITWAKAVLPNRFVLQEKP